MDDVDGFRERDDEMDDAIEEGCRYELGGAYDGPGVGL